MSKTAIIIPARFASTRFPGKPLHPISGKPLIQHVWEKCMRAKEIDLVVVATDDMRIAEVAFAFGAEVAWTSSRHPTGTDRVAEVAKNLRGYAHILNVQGDEPDVDPWLIRRMARSLREEKSLQMVTACYPFACFKDAEDPNNVKVTLNKNGSALYFSRSLIPYDREHTGKAPLLHHMGIYGYRRSFLLEFVKWRQTVLEKTECLEQLRALEHGVAIKVLRARRPSMGIDTPEDARKFEEREGNP